MKHQTQFWQVTKKRKLRVIQIILIVLAALFLLLTISFALVDQVMEKRVLSTLSDELETDVLVAEIDGASLHYRQMGDGDEKLLLIHGFMGSSYDFYKIIPQLAEHFTVYAVDQIGFGLSDKSTALDFSKSSSAKLIEGLMDYLEINQYYVLGHSMGGEVAMHLALNRPDAVRQLVLLNSAGLADPQQGINGKIPVFLIEHFFKNYTLQRIIFNRTVQGQNSANADNFNRFFYFNKQIPAETLASIIQDNDSGSLADRVSDIDQPSLLIWGRQDRIIPLDQGISLNSKMQNSQLIVLEDCGHLPYLEKPQLLSMHILNFLLSKTDLSPE